MNAEQVSDITAKALDALRNQSISGRLGFVTGHTAENDDGSVTVAFRSKQVGKTSTFRVSGIADAFECLKEMRKQTR